MLPTAIPQRTRVELSPRSDQTVRIWSAGLVEGLEPKHYRLGGETPTRTWIDYIQGIKHMAWVFHRFGGG